MTAFPKNSPPRNHQAVSQWLSAYANETSIPIERVYGRFATSVLLAALRRHEVEPAIVLKGGASLDARFGILTRHSRDVDLNIRLAFAAEGLDVLVDRLAAGWRGFTFDLRGPVRIADLDVWRYDLRIGYQGKALKRVPLEVSVQTGAGDRFDELPLPFDLSQLGFGLALKERTFPGVELHDQISQKLHACTERFADRENDRVRDLPDILLLAGTPHFEAAVQRAACEKVFLARATHTWPPALIAEPCCRAPNTAPDSGSE